MKDIFLIALLCMAFVLPAFMVGAQENEVESEGPTVTEQAAPENKAEGAAVAKPAPAKKSVSSKNTVSGWINELIALISQIGGIFGNKLGFRIGGTSGTAIAMLIIAKLIQDKAPSWVKWLLYLGGGTMLTGSGANIAQMVMKDIGL
jgi:hypothetical protein